MYKYIVVISIVLCLAVCGCGFLDPQEKKDSAGNVVLDATGKPVIEAKGSKYLEKTKDVAELAAGFPMFGAIASGIAGLLGVGIAVSNKVARNRANALTATVAGVGEFSRNYDQLKASVITTLQGAGQAELADKMKNLSLKGTISTLAGQGGVWQYLNTIVQKVDPKPV